MGAVFAGLVARLKTFWPMLAGIVCARTALIVACYGSYDATDNGIFTDGAMLVTCAIFAVALLPFARPRRTLGDTTVQWVLVASTAVAAAASMALSLFDSTDPALTAPAFALSVVSTLALSLCMFYWLRCLRGTDEVTAALFAFGAFMASAVIVYGLSFLPMRAQNVIGAGLIIAQLAFIGPAALRDDLASARLHRRARTFFTFARSHMQDGRFLMACTVGIGLLGFVDGFLRGYPDGLPISFTPPMRLAYVLVTLVVCALLSLMVVRRRERVMTVGVFLTMEALACLALVLFAAFPFHLEVGAVLVNTLNVIICAYCWYVIIAFTSFGERDPYFYAMGGWIVCFGSRAVARMLLFFVYPLTGSDPLINSLLGALILLSAQIVLVQFLLAEHREGALEAEEREMRAEEELHRAEADVERAQAALADAESALQTAARDAAAHEEARVAEAVAAVERAALEAVTLAQAQRCIKCTDGCSPEAAKSPAPTPASPNDRTGGQGAGTSLDDELGGTLRNRVRAMGEQFLLSDREVDVLALYAMGHTQKKVAEELLITPATAHTHIKRIYSKCGMHSRQEILEYLTSYGA